MDRAAVKHMRDLILYHEGARGENRFKGLHIQSLWLVKWRSGNFGNTLTSLIPLLGRLRDFVCTQSPPLNYTTALWSEAA